MTTNNGKQDEQYQFIPELKPLESYEKTDLVRVIERALMRMSQFEKKYFDLVWYARKDESMRDGPAEEIMSCVEETYPDDMRRLDEYPDWQHGFNSGCLAAVRLFQEYLCVLDSTETQRQYYADAIESGVEEDDSLPLVQEDDVLAEAEEEFPFLDT